MAESVFKVIEMVGTSTESWGKAASTSRISTPWSSHRSLTHSQERHAPTNRIVVPENVAQARESRLGQPEIALYQTLDRVHRDTKRRWGGEIA